MRRMSKRVEVEVVIPFGNHSSLKAITKALNTNEVDPPTHKSQLRITARQKSLILHVQADELPSLRAVLNSNLRSVLAWKRIVEALE
ncbi:MAG: KEOPS complex subunit Pcc1 [Candidatus Bathyarchaeota archaeon]|nr:KEOPS complex subunit Pcc1 [Candidatus Bathyarchaeota archaeon]